MYSNEFNQNFWCFPFSAALRCKFVVKPYSNIVNLVDYGVPQAILNLTGIILDTSSSSYNLTVGNPDLTKLEFPVEKLYLRLSKGTNVLAFHLKHYFKGDPCDFDLHHQYPEPLRIADHRFKIEGVSAEKMIAFFNFKQTEKVYQPATYDIEFTESLDVHTELTLYFQMFTIYMYQWIKKSLAEAQTLHNSIDPTLGKGIVHSVELMPFDPKLKTSTVRIDLGSAGKSFLDRVLLLFDSNELALKKLKISVY